MFLVIFEVLPRPGHFDSYLGYAKLLRPEIEKIDGFVDNVRYRSLTRDGWVLSLSSWRDEKALIRWRTHAQHHVIQEKGRNEVFADYRLRVGQVTVDTRIPRGYRLLEQRLDETESALGTTATLADVADSPQWVKSNTPDAIAKRLGLRNDAAGPVAWDVFEAVLTPGSAILLCNWRDRDSAESFEASDSPPHDARYRRVRVVRDYGMFDRREAPQYFPDVNTLAQTFG
jgi:heme-degrading monooxygenase HmoA